MGVRRTDALGKLQVDLNAVRDGIALKKAKSQRKAHRKRKERRRRSEVSCLERDRFAV